MIPSVAIVGRANVGKSSLFNALCGTRVAIVDSKPGITRDRVAREVNIDGRRVEIVDTGGVGMESAEEIAADVELQIEIAITRADLIIFLVDAKHGIHPMDKQIGRRLRQAGQSVLLVANKTDVQNAEPKILEFYELGFGEPLRVAATQRKGMSELEQEILQKLPPSEKQHESSEALKIAFTGRRNAGKSTMINFLANEPRVVVSEMPGTTRDSVDVKFQLEDESGITEFVAIDTAGIRKRKQISESVDYYSQVRTKRAIGRADVVVLVIDSTVEIGRVDKQLADEITSQHKPVVVALNKADLIPEDTEDEAFVEYVWQSLAGIRFAPLVLISALTGENVVPMLRIVQHLHEEAGFRVQTSELNDIMEEVTGRKSPPSKRSGHGKIFYATQVETHPPTIVLFVNDAARITGPYERYLAGQLRDHLPYGDIPIKFLIRRREKSVESETH
ncbi:MAG: ribosome biogenesis GTPase Der [Candidatus Brocadiia bacterium]